MGVGVSGTGASTGYGSGGYVNSPSLSSLAQSFGFAPSSGPTWSGNSYSTSSRPTVIDQSTGRAIVTQAGQQEARRGVARGYGPDGRMVSSYGTPRAIANGSPFDYYSRELRTSNALERDRREDIALAAGQRESLLAQQAAYRQGMPYDDIKKMTDAYASYNAGALSELGYSVPGSWTNLPRNSALGTMYDDLVNPDIPTGDYYGRPERLADALEQGYLTEEDGQLTRHMGPGLGDLVRAGAPFLPVSIAKTVASNSQSLPAAIGSYLGAKGVGAYLTDDKEDTAYDAIVPAVSFSGVNSILNYGNMLTGVVPRDFSEFTFEDPSENNYLLDEVVKIYNPVTGTYMIQGSSGPQDAPVAQDTTE